MLKRIIIGSILILLSLATASGVLAESVVNFTPQVSIPDSGFQAQQEVMVKNDTSMICDYIVAIYKYAIAIVGVLAVLAIAIGGVMWIVAAGNSGVVGEGKQWIISGILGLVLALGSFILLATINKDLVTCKVSTLPSIAPRTSDITQAQINATSVYGKPGLSDKQVTKSIDSSGKYQCCIIYGKLSGSGWVADTKIKRCATYEAADATVAQPECNVFYDTYGTKGKEKTVWPIMVGSVVLGPLGSFAGAIVGETLHMAFTDNMLKLDSRESPPPGSNQPGNKGAINSAAIYEGKCWENTETKNICVGTDNADFCKSHSDGTACLINGSFGYCKAANGSSSCYACLKHCDACTDDYQCPNQRIDPQAWLEKAKNDPTLMDFGNPGSICGSQIYSFWSSDSSDCASGKCDKEFGTPSGCP